MIEVVVCVAIIGIFIQYMVMYNSLVNRLRIEQSIRLRNIERVDYIRNYIKYNCNYEDIKKNINETLYLSLDRGDLKDQYKTLREKPEGEEYISIRIEEGDNPYVLNIEIVAVDRLIEVAGIIYKGKSVK